MQDSPTVPYIFSCQTLVSQHFHRFNKDVHIVDVVSIVREDGQTVFGFVADYCERRASAWSNALVAPEPPHALEQQVDRRGFRCHPIEIKVERLLHDLRSNYQRLLRASAVFPELTQDLGLCR